MKQATSKLLISAIAAAALAAIVLIAAAGSGNSPSPEPVGGLLAGDSAKGPRTVLVSTGPEPAPSRPGTRLHALRLSGPIPSRRSLATVLSDEDCAPDSRGVSHCINRMRLANGRVLTVRHPHRMMEVPCLARGEHVTVRHV